MMLSSAIHRSPSPRRRSSVGDVPPWFISLPDGISEGQLVEALKATAPTMKTVKDYCDPHFIPLAAPAAGQPPSAPLAAKPPCSSLPAGLNAFCVAGRIAADDIWARRGFADEATGKVVQRGLLYQAFARYTYMSEVTTAGRALIDAYIDRGMQGGDLQNGLADLLAAQWLYLAALNNQELLSKGDTGGGGTTTTITTQAPATFMDAFWSVFTLAGFAAFGVWVFRRLTGTPTRRVARR